MAIVSLNVTTTFVLCISLESGINDQLTLSQMKVPAFGAELPGDVEISKGLTLTPVLESVTALSGRLPADLSITTFSNPQTGESP
jgi:hypothetical protein